MVNQYKDTHNKLENLKLIVVESNENYEFIKKMTKNKINENTLLKCFLKELEAKILNKEN